MIVGIDPGLKGAIAYIDTAGAASYAMPMPIAAKEIDGREIAGRLIALAPSVVIIEKAQAMSKNGKQGVTGMFSYGKGFGIIIGVCEALGLPYRLVTPQSWKKTVLAGTAKDKDAAISFVRRAYPHVNLAPGRKRVPHDGMADAVCIAEYGRQLMGREAA